MSDGLGSSIRSCLIVLSQRLNQQDPDATAQAFSGPMKARTDHPQAKSFNKPTDHEIIQTLSLDCQPGPGKPLPWRIRRGSLEKTTCRDRHQRLPTFFHSNGRIGSGRPGERLQPFRGGLRSHRRGDCRKMNPQALQQWDGVVFANTTGDLPIPNREYFTMAPQRKGFHWHALQFRHLSWLPQVCRYDRRRVPDPWPRRKSRLAWRIATILHVSITENRFRCMMKSIYSRISIGSGCTGS